MLLISSNRVSKISEILGTKKIKSLKKSPVTNSQNEEWKSLLVINCVNGIAKNDNFNLLLLQADVSSFNFAFCQAIY